MLWLLSVVVRLGFLLAHVSSKNSFLMPLSREKEEEYVLLWTQTGDTVARDKLIEHNLRLVAHIVKKYAGSADNDDLISIGTIGLIKAIATYRPEKSAHLATYASRCIENEILMYLRSTKKQRCEISLQEPIGTDKDGNEVTLIDMLGSKDMLVHDAVELKIRADLLYEKLKSLNKRERRVLELRYGLFGKTPLTQRETAQILDISRSYVSRIEKAAVEKLRQQYVDEIGTAEK